MKKLSETSKRDTGEQLWIDIRDNHHGLLLEQSFSSVIVAPNSVASRKSRCASKNSPHHSQTLFNPVLLIDRYSVAIQIRNEKHNLRGAHGMCSPEGSVDVGSDRHAIRLELSI